MTTPEPIVLRSIQCPYCWSRFQVQVELSEWPQTYIQDCEVCCHPIVFAVAVSASGDLSVEVRHQDDA